MLAEWCLLGSMYIKLAVRITTCSIMRQSVALPRASSAMQGGSSAALSKLIEKKKEYDAVSALERASALYLERIEALGEEFDIMANAGEGAFSSL